VQANKIDSNQYAYLVKLAAFAATTTALILVVLKLYAFFVTDASAMLASATDSILDLFASIMNVVILRFALAPADKEHKFGHGKAESLAGLVQAAFVLGSALLLVFNGVDRIINPQEVVRTEVGIVVSIIAIVLTLLLVMLQKYVINQTKSVAISADSLHYQSDLILNLGVLAALFLSQGYWLQADGAFTVAVAIFLLIGAGKIIWNSVHHLMDHELTEEELNIIKKIILSHEGTYGLHELRTRQAGPDRFIQFHL
jgi:ferrous-iron efflux pump FieF